MRVKLLPSVCLIALAGCVATPKLPDAAEQAAQFSRQAFSPDYRVAITSRYQDTKVMVDVSRKFVRFVESEREARRIALAEQTERDMIASDFSFSAGSYNYHEGVSAIEGKFGESLQTALNVTPVYYSRPRIQKMLDDELLKTSAMMHAKTLAKREGLDAVLVVYFEPFLVESDTPFGPEYRLYYETQVAMRSVADDKLIYNRGGRYTCAKDLVSTSRSKRGEALDTMERCEAEIHEKVVADFVEFARRSGK